MKLTRRAVRRIQLAVAFRKLERELNINYDSLFAFPPK